MKDALGKARQEALHSVFTRLGLDGARFKIEPGSKAAVTCNWITIDRRPMPKDGQKLKVSSEPKKDTKVEAGDKIKITITASVGPSR